jgi:tetratricopeptide (TPR) repeat protein
MMAFLAASSFLGAAAEAALARPDSCTPAVARVVSIEGSVKVAASDTGALHDAQLDETVCAGYVIEVGDRSRAALQLTNETTIRLDQRSRLVIAGFAADESSGLALSRGALHVLTRTRQRFRVTTPFINANINGTEFTVRVDRAGATVSVTEGEVRASRDAESVSLTSGEAAVGRPNEPLRKDIAVRGTGAVEWALYYPAVFDYAAAQREAPLASPEASNDPRLLTRSAGLLLAVGRLDEAERFIARALAIDARNGDAHALLAVIAVVRNEKDKALAEGREATASDPASPAAWIALSYAQQAAFQVEQAARTMEEARAKVAPNALFLARLAELYMSVGDVDKAVRTAEEARALDPRVAKIQTVSGFAYLIRIDTQKAKDAFTEAISLDPADPLPRLGLGLAKIREGDLAGGRGELEIAAVLDPGNSLIRSYLGKAYYEEKRNELAATQFDLAKQRDPADPTPLFYDAILQETLNRPVTALRELQDSVDKNGNRAVYRSKLQIDQDLAARTVNVARIYQDLGFNRLALSEGYNAIAADPGEAATHLFLADAYSNLPRHDIARVSEALQARLRQPVSLPAIDLQLNTDNLLILRDTGPSRLGTNEFNRLFNRNQVAAQIDGVVGDLSTGGDEVILGVVQNNVAFSASQLHYETDGFVQNGRGRKNIYDVFVQGDVSPAASFQVEIKRSEFKTGENIFPFDPDAFVMTTISERSDVLRIGGRLSLGGTSETIWTAMYEDRERTVEFVPDPFVINQDDARTYAVEAQHLVRGPGLNWILGVGYAHTDDHFIDENTIVSDGGNVYLYGQWLPAPRVRIDAGAAAEFVKVDYSAFTQNVSRHRLSPKFGITWMPTADTTIRAAALQTVKRPLIASQTLEPTHVAGCNQFFSGFDNFYGDIMATVSRRVCVGIDQRITRTAFVGAEVTGRNLRVPSVFSQQDYSWKERTAHLYAYKAFDAGSLPWLPTAQAGLSVEYQREKVERSRALTGPEGIIEVTTDRVPIAFRLYASEALSGGVTTAYVRQRGKFGIDEGLPEFDKNDRAWITDAFVEYRMPRRLGFISVGARNLFDQSIDVFETDPFNPQIPTRRFVYAKVRLLF